MAAEGAAVPSEVPSKVQGEALNEVHGVLHQLTAADLAALSNCEHEYW
jgi:hypothetical protein